MENPFRLSFPHRGWAKISWHPDAKGIPTAQQRRAFERLARIPGCSFSGCVIQAPRTVWMLDAWRVVLDVTETWEASFAPPIVDSAFGDYVGGWAGVSREPYPWQIEAANKILGSQSVLLCDDMGIGKTSSALLAAAFHQDTDGQGAPVLIVAPGFTVEVWRGELEALGLLDDPEDFCALRTRNLNHGSYRKGARFYFVHFDVVKAWASRISSSIRPCVAIVDEIHYAKNGRAQRTKGAQIAAGIARIRVGLTGTPMDNRPVELHAPLEIICGKGSWGHPIEFRKRYCGAQRGDYGWHDTGPTKIDELRQRLAPFYLRRTLDDIDHDLPPLRRSRVTVPLNTFSRRAHKDLTGGYDVEELVDAVVKGRAGPDVFRTLHQLREVTSKLKYKTTVACIESLLEQGQSVVCFSWRRQTAVRIEAATGVDSSTVVHGGIPQDVRDIRIADFQERGGLLCATYASLKEGVTLTRARAVVLHDLDWTPSTILQAEKRIHRLGQKSACMSYWVVAEDSIDTILARLLTLKADWISETLGIDAAAEAVDAVDLAEVAPQFDATAWARAQMERWR